jgi:hypothetical protein
MSINMAYRCISDQKIGSGSLEKDGPIEIIAMKRECPVSKILDIKTRSRHGWFTNLGSEDDRCPMHYDGGEIFLFCEQIIVVIGLFQ